MKAMDKKLLELLLAHVNGHCGLAYAYRLYDARGRVIGDDTLALNLVPIEGFNHMLNATLRAQAQIPTWYCSLYANDWTPDLNVTAATYPGLAGEFTGYAESTRVEFVEGTVAGGATSNAAALCTFNFNAGGTIRGAGLHGAATKGATSSVLLSAARFPSPKNAEAGGKLDVLISPTLSNPA